MKTPMQIPERICGRLFQGEERRNGWEKDL